MKYIMFTCLTAAILLPGSWFGLSHFQKPTKVHEAAKKELLKAAKAHGVTIEAANIRYMSNQKMTIVRAPIKGIDKYTSVDFEKGAPIVLMIIKSTVKLALPDGSYVARIKYPRGAKSGMAIFTDAEGKQFAKQDLDKPIWTVLDDPSFPDPGSPDPGDFGKREPENCDGYVEDFPIVLLGPIPGAAPGTGPGFSFPCRDCARAACLSRRAKGGLPGLTEESPRGFGYTQGRLCAASPAFECPALPRLGP